MLRNRTANLVKLSAEASGGTTSESLYRRFQNFFLRSMGRTNWKFGKLHTRILAVAVAVNKAAVPVVWTVLPQSEKRDDSNTKAHIRLIERLLQAEDICALTTESECARKALLLWLDRQRVKYVARIRRNKLMDGSPASDRRRAGQRRASQVKPIWKLVLFFAGCRITGANTRDAFLYLGSNHYHENEATGPCKQRWGIEQVLSYFKKREFDLETIHMTAGTKREKLFAVLTLAFLMSCGWGCRMEHDAPLKSGQKRKAMARLGLDRIAQMLSDRVEFEDEKDALAPWFSRPKFGSF